MTLTIKHLRDFFERLIYGESEAERERRIAAIEEAGTNAAKPGQPRVARIISVHGKGYGG